MDALERAKHLIKSANESEDIEGYTYGVQEAHAMAAIAQAEQLKRIAKALENIGEAQAARAFGYFPNDDDGREAIQPGDYHYFHKGTSDPEF